MVLTKMGYGIAALYIGVVAEPLTSPAPILEKYDANNPVHANLKQNLEEQVMAFYLKKGEKSFLIGQGLRLNSSYTVVPHHLMKSIKSLTERIPNLGAYSLTSRGAKVSYKRNGCYDVNADLEIVKVEDDSSYNRPIIYTAPKINQKVRILTMRTGQVKKIPSKVREIHETYKIEERKEGKIVKQHSFKGGIFFTNAKGRKGDSGVPVTTENGVLVGLLQFGVDTYKEKGVLWAKQMGGLNAENIARLVEKCFKT